MAKTENVWDPSASPLYALGLVHEPATPASSLHVNVELPFVEVNAKLAEVLALGFVGELVIVVFGAVDLAATATPPESEVATRLIAVAASRVSQRGDGAREPRDVDPTVRISVPPSKA